MGSLQRARIKRGTAKIRVVVSGKNFESRPKPKTGGAA